MIKVYVTGASGNVGRTLVRTVRALDDFELVGGWARETGDGVILTARKIAGFPAGTFVRNLAAVMTD